MRYVEHYARLRVSKNEYQEALLVFQRKVQVNHTQPLPWSNAMVKNMFSFNNKGNRLMFICHEKIIYMGHKNNYSRPINIYKISGRKSLVRLLSTSWEFVLLANVCRSNIVLILLKPFYIGNYVSGHQ